MHKQCVPGAPPFLRVPGTRLGGTLHGETTNCQNWGWALAWVWALAQDNTVACSLDMAVYRQQLPTHLDKYGSLL